MSDYKELLDELRSKWLFPRSIEAADLIERLIRERDEALARLATADQHVADLDKYIAEAERRASAKAIEEAAAVAKDFGLPVSEELNMALTYRQKNISEAILALKEKPFTVQE